MTRNEQGEELLQKIKELAEEYEMDIAVCSDEFSDLAGVFDAHISAVNCFDGTEYARTDMDLIDINTVITESS